MIPGGLPIIRACCQCELEHGILDRSDPTKSHGLCKRHMIDWARAGGLRQPDIEEIVARTEAGKGFPPDLGPVFEEVAA